MLCYLILVIGIWTQWNKWSSCTVTCGSGSRTRSRTCSNLTQQYRGTQCTGADIHTSFCNNQLCPGTLSDIYLTM